MARLAWTAEEDRILLDGLASGMAPAEIVCALPGRTKSAALSRAFNLRGTSADAFEENVRIASEGLRSATLQLVERSAALMSVTPYEALARLVGKEPPPKVPGSEFIHKTASMQRLAA